jgi:hypothetical protein
MLPLRAASSGLWQDEARRWPLLAYGFACVIAAGLSFFLAGIPVQVSDSLGNLEAVQRVTWPELLWSQLSSRAYFRPLLLAQTKALLDLSFGHYFFTFRAFQIAQVFLCLGLFVRLLRVRTGGDAVAAAVAVAALAGSHTFAGTVREAYPINNYMTIVLCCLVAMNVQMGARSRWYTDLLVLAAFVLAVGTIETGLLVWGCVFIGFISGWRGVSRWAMTAATLLVLVYFALRLFVFDIGLPDLIERSSGFGFERLDARQLTQRFGPSPGLFYAYNVASSVATVLFSEPRAGVWMFFRELSARDITPAIGINVAASTAATALVLWFAASVRWRRSPSEWSHGQRLVLLAAAAVVANAGISYPYTKDQIMSVGGVMFAAALFAAAAHAMAVPPARTAASRCVALLVCIGSAAWCWRVLGLQHNLVHTAFTQRNDWAYIDRWFEQHPEAQRDPAIAHLVEALRTAALVRRVPNPHVESSVFEDYFDHHTD